MQGGIEIRVLGPLEVVRDGRPIDVRGSKRRAVLAMLVLHANEVVRTDRLIEDLWGEQRPVNAHAALQNHVSRLRRDIGADVLVTKPWGYVLRVDPEAIDLRRFERLVAESRPLAAKERAQKLAEALALWRGAALADLAHEGALAVEIDRLDELRLVASEERIDADLELGGHSELVQELEGLVAEHPLRERLRGQLILALYRAGRQAEALETYRETRRVLVEELGIEPSSELRELERAILRQDPSLAVPPLAPNRPDPPSESTRWRWPRSPVGVAAALVLLAGAGAVTAALLTGGGPSAVTAAAPTDSSTSSTRPETTTTTPEQPPPRRPPSKKPTREREVSTATTTTVSETVAETNSSQPDPPPASRTETTERETTTTTTAKAKPKPKPTPTSLAPWYLLADDFEDPAFDHGLWHVAANPDPPNIKVVSAAERNGRLEFSVDPKDIPAGLPFADTHYGTQCRVDGDFDVRVDYELLAWPPRHGVFVSLIPWFPNSTTTTQISRIGQFPTWGSEGYNSAIRWSQDSTGSSPYADNQTVQTADMSGSLRATRVDGDISTYYRYRGRWTRLASALARGPVHLLLGLSFRNDPLDREPVAAAFDNFEATVESVDCGPHPLPPRVPHP